MLVWVTVPICQRAPNQPFTCPYPPPKNTKEKDLDVNLLKTFELRQVLFMEGDYDLILVAFYDPGHDLKVQNNPVPAGWGLGKINK